MNTMRHSVIVTLLFLLLSCTGKRIEKGDVSLSLGDYAMAMSFYGEVLQKDPTNVAARVGMGKAWLQKAIDNDNDTTSWNTALTHLEAARTLEPGEPLDSLLAEVWSVHARNLLFLKDTLEALSALSRAIEYRPRSAEPLSLAGIVYFRLGDPGKAERLFRQALALDTLHASTYFNLGMVHWSNGDAKEAYALWLKALKRAPEDNDILYWFARARKKLEPVNRDQP